MKRFLNLRVFLIFLVVAVVGCGDTENVFVNNSGSGSSGLSGQTGTITVQTQLAAPVAPQEVLVIRDEVIPSQVTDLRFTGTSAQGSIIYGPITQPKSGDIYELTGVPIEVAFLRIELLVDGSILGGLVTRVDVSSGQPYLLLDPVYIFAGVAPGPDDTGVVYGLFIGADNGFNFDNSVVLDYPIPQVTNGVTYLGPADPYSESTLGRGQYRVSQSGDYLLTYKGSISLQQEGPEPGTAQVFRNEVGIENTVTSDYSIFSNLQHIVHLDANDYVSLRVNFGGMGQSINAQTEQEFSSPGGTFTIVRLGDGGTVHPPAPEPERQEDLEL